MTVSRILGALAACLLAWPAYSQVENQDYELLTPAQKPATHDSGGKVEVLEFFSYGCPHCAHFHPMLSKWAAQLPSNAVLVRVPVSLGRREWGQLSRAYYALQATGDLARLDDAIFKAIHEDGRRLFSEDEITAWVAEHGVDAQKFRQAFNSPEVSAKAMQAERMSRDYKVNGIPFLSVDGKYVVIGKSYEDMLRNARALVDKSAAERQAQAR